MAGPEGQVTSRTATESKITVRSRAAELLMQSRRNRELVDQLGHILSEAGLWSPEPPSDAAEVASVENLPGVFTETIINNEGTSRKFEELIEAIKTELL